MSEQTDRAAERKRIEDARIAAIQAHANAVPPTPEYLEAKAQLLANRKARR